MNKLKKQAGTFIKIVFSVSLLGYVFFQYTDYLAIGQVLSDVNAYFIFAVLVLVFILRWFAALQVRYVFGQIGIPLPTLSIFKVQFISNFYAFFLPGELASAGISWYMFSRIHNSKIRLAGALAYTRIINLLILVPFIFGSIVFSPELFTYHQKITLILTSLSFIGVVALVFSPITVKILQSLAGRTKLSARLNPYITEISLIQSQFKMLNMAQQVKNVLLSLLIYFGNVMLVWLLMKMLHLQVSFMISFIVFPILVFVSYIPFFFAGTGIRELSLIFFLAQYGVNDNQAFVYSISFFALNMVLVIAGGLYLPFYRNNKPSTPEAPQSNN